MSHSGNRKKTTENMDEVEELLRAAQDEMLLNLSVDSHMSRGSSSHIIDPDLDRRFQSLKSRITPSKRVVKNKLTTPIPPQPPSIVSTSVLTDHDEPKADDLYARFTALKGTLPSSSSSSLNNNQRPKGENIDQDVDDDDEVEKLIKWAIDAARLDPSPPSDDDTNRDEDDSNDDDDSEEEEEDEDDDDNKNKVSREKRGKRK